MMCRAMILVATVLTISASGGEIAADAAGAVAGDEGAYPGDDGRDRIREDSGEQGGDAVAEGGRAAAH